MDIFERFKVNVLMETPIKYMGFVLYPVKMKDVFEFNKVSGILLINPMDFNDPKITAMGQLELIINLCGAQEEFKESFLSLLKMVFQVSEDDIKVNIQEQDHQIIYTLLISQKKDGNGEQIWKEISSSKFSAIKDVICFQNGLEVIDFGQNEDIIRTKRALAQKANNGEIPSISEQIYSVSCETGIDVKEIMNWTINRFNEILKACDRIIHYKIYKSAELSGMVTFKNGIPVKSWLKSEDNSEGKLKTLAEASNAFGGVIQ